MAKLELTKTRLQAGVWEGVLSGASADAPDIEVTHEAKAITGVVVTPADAKGQFTLSVPIPSELLSDGVQTFLISETSSGDVLNSFAIVTGEALNEDLRGEIDLMRAELDLLKRAFRRYYQETT